jgi:signal transduction histidine kinase
VRERLLKIKKIFQLVWPLALVFVGLVLLITANEVAYKRSQLSARELENAMQVRLALQTLVSLVNSAETGQRGYLLTGLDSYLAPYNAATAQINEVMDTVRQSVLHDRAMVEEFAGLSRAVSRKLAELEMSVTLKKSGQEVSWRAVVDSHWGKLYMSAVQEAATKLASLLDTQTQHAQIDINNTLFASRMAILVGIVLSAVSISLLFRQMRRFNRLQAEIKHRLQSERDLLEAQVLERTQRLSLLANHLETAREDERNHLARELHDELGALLTAAKLDVARLHNRMQEAAPEIKQRLDHLVQTLNAGIALKRRLIEGLRPSSLSNLGLISTLEILAKETSARTGMQINLNLQPVPMNAASELTAYRFVQESLTNICNHAAAQQVDITLQQQEGQALITVQDNGKGFNQDNIKRPSFGLEGMRQRLLAAGGTLQIQSQLGQGTQVQARLPLQEEQPQESKSAVLQA